MEKTREKSFLNIKSKLTAAIAMLLVAFFMVISSSYAWFTLSTAPEVTGIYTKVGANGNLEIALYNGTDPTSNVGDSDKDTTLKNLTWGNIVDLSAESYGLSNVSLLPSRLNLALNGNQYQVATAPLLTPTYGSDGRISTLTPNTMTAVYNTSTNSFVSSTADASYGVRAIGTSTTMSQQQIDFRNAKYNISTAVTSAKTKAAQSLTENGSALANILAAKATADDNTTYDLSCAKTLISQLEAANNEIEKAIRAYFDALFAIAKQTETEENYNTAKATLATMTLDALFKDTTYSTLIDSKVGLAYEEYKNNVTAISYAETALNNVTSDILKNITAVVWADVDSVLIKSGLVKIDGAKLNGYTADVVKDNMSELVNDVLLNGAAVTLDDNGGVYSNIAKVCGNYSADIRIPEIKYNDMMIKNMPAKMNTSVTVNYDIYASVPATGPTNAESSTSKLTDFYGYAIDLAFRTNAANSNLMLQTTPTNRIYTDGSGTPDTMGKGSTMTFTSTTTDFTIENVAELMSAIRIIFTDSSGNVVAVGLLDTKNATKVGTEVTASLRLCEYNTINNGTDGAPDYRIEISTTTTETGETIKWKDSDEEGKSAIMALTQNQVMRLSAYVYLDGDLVDNTMVANAASSMIGSLNLQFSSDATLVPMNYSPLQDASNSGTTSGTTTTEATTTATTVAP